MSNNPFTNTGAPLGMGVPATAEFDRIMAIPKRSLAEVDVTAITTLCKSPDHLNWDRIRRLGPSKYTVALPEVLRGLNPEQPLELRQIQAQAILEMAEMAENHNVGTFNPIGVGHGKFLISALGPSIVEDVRKLLGKPEGRWLLFVPANLLPQTRRELVRMSRHFRVWPKLEVMTYEALSSAKSCDNLLKFAPTDIILDEGHALRSPKSARTRRFKYYRDVYEPNVYFMSGSITKGSVRDYEQCMRWSLKKYSILPSKWYELQMWSQALDEVAIDGRREPGALMQLIEDAQERARASALPHDERLKALRQAFAQRLISTPGVIATSEQSVDTSLIFQERTIKKIDPAIADALHKIRTTGEDPNGDLLDPIQKWRRIEEVSNGFYLKWRVPAPKEWMVARRDWHRVVAAYLDENTPGLDSPLQVANGIDHGKLTDGADELRAWREIENTFTPEPQPVWLSNQIIDDAIAWSDEEPDRSIIWCQSPALGQKIEHRSNGRIKYLGGGTEASTIITTYKGPIVASLVAHKTGKNLQDRYHRNLVLQHPSNPDHWEQLIGRTHRTGQQADSVDFFVYLTQPEQVKAFVKARARAGYIEQTTRQRQRLSYADIAFADKLD